MKKNLEVKKKIREGEVIIKVQDLKMVKFIKGT